MGKEDALNPDEFLPEFGVTRRELEAEVKRRIASLDSGLGVTTEQLREELRERQQARQVGSARNLVTSSEMEWR